MKMDPIEAILAIGATILLLLVLSAFNPAIIEFAVAPQMIAERGETYYFGLAILLSTESIISVYLLTVVNRSEKAVAKKWILLCVTANLLLCFGVLFYAAVLPWATSLAI